MHSGDHRHIPSEWSDDRKKNMRDLLEDRRKNGFYGELQRARERAAHHPTKDGPLQNLVIALTHESFRVYRHSLNLQRDFEQKLIGFLCIFSSFRRRNAFRKSLIF